MKYTLLDGGMGSELREQGVRVPDHVKAWLDAGATIIGGCCSTRPAHIAQLRALLDR